MTLNPKTNLTKTLSIDVWVGFVASPRTGITSFNPKNKVILCHKLIFVPNHSQCFILNKSRKGNNMTTRYINLIAQNREQFSDDFVEWFPMNENLWRSFVRETFTVIGVGFKHYSARTIIHFLRHHTAVMERSLSGFKINNNYSPYLARLFALAYPDRAYIFRYKHTPKAHKDNRGRRENRDFFEDEE